MLTSGRRQRAGRLTLSTTTGLLLGALAFFLGFGALTAVMLLRDRETRDEDLVQELQTARIYEPGAVEGWPQWRGPGRDGHTAVPGLITSWPKDGPRILWRAETGPGYSSVSVANGRAYTLFQGDRNEETVACWDAVTGEEKWRYTYAGGRNSRDYPGTRSTPTVDGNQVFTLGGAGILCCLDATTGKETWKLDLLQEFHAESPQWGMAASPLVHGDRVFVNPGGKNGNSVAALDRVTGKVLWRRHDFPAGYSSPIELARLPEPQIVFFTAAGLVAVAPDDGRLFWQYPWVTDFGVNAATPLSFTVGGKTNGWDNYLFITSDYGKGCALLKVPRQALDRIQCVYTNNQMLCKFSSPVRVGNHVYGISDPGGLTCLDIRTGEVMWREKKFSVNGSLIVANDYLLVLSERGDLALVEPSPEGYREKAFCRVFRQSSGNWSTPALADGRLYIRNGDEMFCLDMHQ